MTFKGINKAVTALCMVLVLLALTPGISAAAPTAADTDLDNQASVQATFTSYTITIPSNIETIKVQEVLDHTLIKLDAANITVASGAIAQVLTFQLDNTGNGSDSYSFLTSIVTGNDFTPSSVSIYFDSNSSGTYDAGDTLYVPGTNEPTVAAGGSLRIFVVSDIPAAAVEGDLASVQLDSASVTGTGPAGTILAGQGDGGTDAIIGASQGTGSAVSTYEVGVTLSLVKSAIINDPSGGSLPVSGATVEYTIQASVSGTGTLTNVVITDVVPQFTTYQGGSLFLNTVGTLSDVGGDDAGDFNATITNGISVDLGTMDASSGTKTIRFRVKID